MSVLAIDPGTTAGFYVVNKDKHSVFTLKLKQKEIGSRLNTFLEHLDVINNRHWVNHIVFEDPFVSSYRSARFQYAMTGLIYIAAYRQKATITSLHPSKIKKLATGKGNAKKDEMIAAAKAAVPDNIYIDNEHEADAYWVYRTWLHNQETANA